ncbi:DUF317 domain-containing protein [Streptomyces sp. NPDC006872]|uniref:DUF317 domain-containing protein n=1 Tax=Streptomyces sp. NPDC006872 TaxID=3155720 RepID=UPI0033E6636D
MPDTEEIDGDVYVTPRYLAGTTWTGDPALAPLLALGWDLQHDENGNVYVTAPDRKVRLGYLPEGPDDGLWRITAYEDPFAQPKWGASFNNMCPTEFVTAFTTALAEAYTTGPAAYLPEPADDGELDAFRAVAPLIQRGWAIQHPRWGVLEVRTPDGLVSLEYTTGRLDADLELTTLQARWYLQGGPAAAGWYATASTHTPVHLVTALTTCVSDPEPLPRWKDSMLHYLTDRAQLTPVTPPGPPMPTPLDVHRAATRRRPAPTARSVPRWSTSSPPAAAVAPRSPARC